MLQSGRVGVGAKNSDSTESRELDELTRDLNDVCRGATLNLALQVGELVVLRLFGGSVDAWQQGGSKRPSYRKLAARPDLALSPSALCRAVSVYVLTERLGGMAQWSHLGASHLQEVLTVPPSAQANLLLRANDERWTVSQLRAAVSELRHGPTAPVQNGLLRALRQVNKALTAQRNIVSSSEAHGLPSDFVQTARDNVAQIREHLAVLEDALSLAEQPPESGHSCLRALGEGGVGLSR